MSGLGPAVLICLMLAIYSFFRSGKVAADNKFSFERVRIALREGIWALLLPVVILGGIYSGVFTATEAASVSVVYALFVEFVIHRELQVADLPKIILDATQSMGALVMIIMLSLLLNHFMVEEQLGEQVLAKITEWHLGPVAFLVAMNVFLILTGMVMDSISAIVLFTPLIVPAAVGLGLDPLHVGIVFIVNMEIGYLAPPIATNLFVSASIFKKPFGEVTRAVLPTLGIMVVGLILVTYIPTISTGPVYALKGESFIRPFAHIPDAAPPEEVEDPAAPPKVMSLEEMMKRAREPEAPPAPPKVMSLEEMMKKAKKDAPAEPEAATPTP